LPVVGVPGAKPNPSPTAARIEGAVCTTVARCAAAAARLH
jgi:hypothetical protein